MVYFDFNSITPRSSFNCEIQLYMCRTLIIFIIKYSY